MFLCQTKRGLKIQNREKVNYHPTNWIAGVEYEEIDNDTYYPYMPETDADNYSTGYYEE